MSVQRNDLSKMGGGEKATWSIKEKNEPSLNEHPSPPYFVVSSIPVSLSLISLPPFVQTGHGITRTNSSINSIRQRVLPTLTSAAEGWTWKLRETTLVSVLRGLRRSLCSNYLVCSINSRLYTRYFAPSFRLVVAMNAVGGQRPEKGIRKS